MRNFIKIAILSIIVSACGNSEVAAIKNVTINIEGMSCEHSCAPTIQEKLSVTEGVEKAQVSFQDKKAVVTFDENIVKGEDLKKAVESIEDGAYKVKSIE